MAVQHTKLIGLFGGTFDPIHNGHCQLALDVISGLFFDEIMVIPSFQPVHRKQPGASIAERWAMVESVCRKYPRLTASTVEIDRSCPSFAIDTVKHFRTRFTKDSLCFILGLDAFQHFDQWRQWQNILQYVHLVIVQRPRIKNIFSENIQKLINEHRLASATELRSRSEGGVWFASIEGPNVSSTMIRERCRHGQPIDDLVCAEVQSIIEAGSLYQC